MHAILQRAFSDGRATLGIIQFLGVAHDPIFTLENPKRKETLDSRIESGIFVCEPYSSKKFRDVFELMDVPGRGKILIHVGNKESDTTGCILVGLNSGMYSGDVAVMESRSAMDLLRAIAKSQSFVLEIRD